MKLFEKHHPASMSQLFYMARKYGKVYAHTHDDGTYSCSITFNTIQHTTLEAKSGHNHKTAEQAITAALHKAKEIVDSLKTLTEKASKIDSTLKLGVHNGKSITTKSN